MLVIRMQRTGRKGHAQFRVVVQDSRRTPTSGKVVAQLGHSDPHTKQTVIDKEKAEFYLSHGAQPSDRAARLLKAEGVKLPKWVKEPVKGEGKVKNPDKRRSTAPEKPAEQLAAKSTEVEASEAQSSTEQSPGAEVPTETEAPAGSSEKQPDVILSDNEESAVEGEKDLSTSPDGSAQGDKEEQAAAAEPKPEDKAEESPKSEEDSGESS